MMPAPTTTGRCNALAHQVSAQHDGGAGASNSLISRRKSRARLASPQPRPTAPVNGAGGITGCRDDSQAPRVVPAPGKIFTHG
jgi:hypothetical protein